VLGTGVKGSEAVMLLVFACGHASAHHIGEAEDGICSVRILWLMFANKPLFERFAVAAIS